MNRKTIKNDIKHHILHESGFRCSNPVCRMIITLDIHHLDYVSEGGGDLPENLIALCPNCHSLHHKGIIPLKSLRSWKMLLISLNLGLENRNIDILLTLHKLIKLHTSGEGVLNCASLISSNLVMHEYIPKSGLWSGGPTEEHILQLTEKGKLFVEEWIKGNQKEAIEL